MLNDKARELLSEPVFAHLAVVVDGKPHVTPVWVGIDDGHVIVNTARGRKKAEALRVGAEVALSATAPENPYEMVMVQGHVADVRTDGADDDIDALAGKYLGVESYPFRQEGEQRMTVVIEPDHVVAG
jgi:PPOX class probable F420-dependent enzyme